MENNFVVQDPLLPEHLAQKLYDTYCSGTTSLKWLHRDFGRFYTYMTPGDILEVLEHFYNDETNPFYHDKVMMRNSHIYIQRLVPGGFLPMHRERVHGVCSGYLTPEDDFENLQEAGSYEWYNEPVWENIDQEKDKPHTFAPGWNKGVLWKQSEEFPMNPFHRVAENKTDKHRYSVQMFFGKDAAPGGVSHTYKKFVRTNFTANELKTGGLTIPNLFDLAEPRVQWMEDNKDIIEELESQGEFLV